MAANKVSNAYAEEIEFYADVPKAVLAAIAVSLATCGGDHLEDANAALSEEWHALFEAGIVPQKPKVARPEFGEPGRSVQREENK